MNCEMLIKKKKIIIDSVVIVEFKSKVLILM